MSYECTVAIVILSLVILGIVAMFLNYKAKFEKNSIKLEKQDNQQKSRITELEKKNGAEQKQLDELKSEVEKLKTNYNEQRTKNK